MGARPFAGIQTLSGSGQPVFGTTLTAGATPRPDPFTNEIGPGMNQTQIEVTVTSTLGFRPGDQVAIGASADFDPGLATVRADVGTIKKIVSSTVLLVQNLQSSHASGEFCVLNEVAGNVRIVPVAGTANDAIYIGNAPTVAAADPSVFDVLQAPGATGSPTHIHESGLMGQLQPTNTIEYWINGTAGDKFCGSLTQV